MANVWRVGNDDCVSAEVSSDRRAVVRQTLMAGGAGILYVPIGLFSYTLVIYCYVYSDVRRGRTWSKITNVLNELQRWFHSLTDRGSKKVARRNIFFIIYPLKYLNRVDNGPRSIIAWLVPYTKSTLGTMALINIYKKKCISIDHLEL